LLSIKAHGGASGASLRGDHASLADYMREELLAPLGPEEQRWLTRSSALGSMTGPLCDTALETTGSLARLRALERRNLFLVPLDDRRTSYRFHHLFAEFLRDELEAREPGAAATIKRRASSWYEAHGDVERAVEHAHEAGDLDSVARLVGRFSLPMFWRGRLATLMRWFGWFDRDDLRARWAPIAVQAGWVEALQGHTRNAERWLAAAQRSTDDSPMPDGTATRAPWVALLRGGLVPDGVATAVADARVAREGIAPDGFWWPTTLVFQVIARLLTGSLDEAERVAVEAVEVAEARGAAPAVANADGWRAALALRRGDTPAAAAAVEHGMAAVEAAGLEDYPIAALLYAIAARLAVSRGSPSEARPHIARLNRLRPQLTASLPWLAVAARIEAIRAYVALGDASAARALLLEVGDVQRVRPDLGWLTTEAAAVREAVGGMRGAGPGPWSLTSAELRLLVYMPTHLTFPEIAARMYLSPHTVKSQAVSIYSKLGVASRRGAIEKAVVAGLLDATVIRHPGGSTGVG
jgi:LuxR family maltose regulon positive regulatory protein